MSEHPHEYHEQALLDWIQKLHPWRKAREIIRSIHLSLSEILDRAKDEPLKAMIMTLATIFIQIGIPLTVIIMEFDHIVELAHTLMISYPILAGYTPLMTAPKN